MHGWCVQDSCKAWLVPAGSWLVSLNPAPTQRQSGNLPCVLIMALFLMLLAVMTATTLAKNASSCITQPGCGMFKNGTATACRIGTFSSGNHKQPCTSCPGSLTTEAARAESVSACMAGPGFFFQVCRQRAMMASLVMRMRVVCMHGVSTGHCTTKPRGVKGLRVLQHHGT